MAAPDPLERVAALAGAGASVVLTALVWRVLSIQQPMWPFPALYFVELMAVGVLVAAAYISERRFRAAIAWAAGGIFAAFSLLAAWTVGLLYAPIALMFLAAGLISGSRQKENPLAHAGIGALAGLAQALLVLAMVRVF